VTNDDGNPSREVVPFTGANAINEVENWGNGR